VGGKGSTVVGGYFDGDSARDGEAGGGGGFGGGRGGGRGLGGVVGGGGGLGFYGFAAYGTETVDYCWMCARFDLSGDGYFLVSVIVG